MWTPSAATRKAAQVSRYMTWLEHEYGLHFRTYPELWRWSVDQLETFWESVWRYFRIHADAPYERVLAGRSMPGARWFEGARLNFAEHALRPARGSEPAVLAEREGLPATSLSWDELRLQVARAADALRAIGVGPGDRVAGYLPNVPEAVVAFLATASLGAIWSACSPEFGSPSVIERLRQIDPKVLFAVESYRYQGRSFDRRDELERIRKALPSLGTVVLVASAGEADRRGETHSGDRRTWEEFLDRPSRSLRFEPVPFDHPLWTLYSSGTTGPPKAIVHGHGGMLLSLLVTETFHLDLGPGDRFFWFSTTGWMMWNTVVAGLLTGATIVLYDGSPVYPSPDALWGLAERQRLTFFGASAAYLASQMKSGAAPGRRFDLRALRAIGSTGSPLPAETFCEVYEQVARDLWLTSVSGGTDICGLLVGGVPILPVHAGEIQGRALGVAAAAFDERGRPVIDQVGELVVTEPMPSMPLKLWGDPDGSRYRASYFGMFPGIWRHGDWVRFTDRGSCVITGRSDATLNRHGVRIGPSEIYSVVEAVPELLDSLVVDRGEAGEGPALLLFVVLRPGKELTEDLQKRLRTLLREQLSPRHVPDAIYVVPEVPKTLNGKKLEVPVKRILLGVPPAEAVSVDALSNPGSLRYFIELAERLRGASDRATAHPA